MNSNILSNCTLSFLAEIN